MTPRLKGAVQEQYFNNSLARGLRVLAAFTPQQSELTILELAELTGLHNSTVFRLVHTLEYLGYLVRNEETRKYRQTARVMALGLAASATADIRDIALPFMEALSKRVQKTVKLAVLDGVEIVFLTTVAQPNTLLLPTPLGHRLPAYCTALGKALLAFQPREKWNGLLQQIDYQPHTDRTITDAAAMAAKLQQVRDQGYAVTDQELAIGLSSVAAPILNPAGEALAAVNLSGLISTLSKDERTPDLIEAIVTCANQISEALAGSYPQK